MALGLARILACAALILSNALAQLVEAAASGNLQKVRSLLDAGADPNTRDKDGRTALIVAMQGYASEYKVVGANEAMAHLLVEHAARVNVQDNDGWSALLKLVDQWADQPDLILYLLDHGADINAHTKEGKTALMLAARLGKEDRVTLLLSRGAAVNSRDAHGSSALMEAVGSRFDSASAIMVRLLDKGADITATDDTGRTGVDQAAEAGRLERVKLLLARGAKTKDRSVTLASARNHALLNSAADAVAIKPLLDEGANPNFADENGRTPLMLAAAQDNSINAVRLLLERGADVNAVDKQSNTALMLAADRYDRDVVDALLKNGADPNARDAHRNTPLIRAGASRHSFVEERKPLIHLLVEKDADVTASNDQGVTALMLMAQEGNSGMLLLLDRGAPVDARDHNGNTALLCAARFMVRPGERAAAEALLEKGADVNAANNDGETPLILAATQYQVEAANILITAGANISARTKHGRTALMQAIDGPTEFDNERHIVYSPRIVQLLIAHGADVNARDEDGSTALQLAALRGHQDIIPLLREHVR